MNRTLAVSSIVVAALVLVTGCRSGADLSRPETQRQFGVRMAKMNLWREAMFRFQRAVEIEPQNAMAHNNLAVAYEAVGDFDAAATAYREAMRLDRSNQYIQKNYSRFVEFTQRSKRRETGTATQTSAAPVTPKASSAVTPAAGVAAPAVPDPAPAEVPQEPPPPPPGMNDRSGGAR